MTVPKRTIWRRDEHTGAKHSILRQYLAGWFPIMLRAGFTQVTYFEGFAGPGVYEEGEPGSPIIAMQLVTGRSGWLRPGQRSEFVFIEERADRIRVLEGKIQRDIPQVGGVSWHAHHGRFQDLMIPALSEARAWGSPMFANLDPFGPSIPYDLLERIAQNPSSEALITFMADFFRRFADEERRAADLMFGPVPWHNVSELPAGQAKILFLVEAYRELMYRAGFKYVLAFEILDEGGRRYFLMYGTNAKKGLEIMKAAMWKVDRVYGIRFRDPRDPQQTALLVDQPDLTPLSRTLQERLEDGQRHTVADLRDFALFETVYRSEHAMRVLQELKRAGKLGQDPSKGKIRRDGEVWLFLDA